MQVEDRPLLRDRRVLFVDADGNVRSAAHGLLDRYRVTVETAHDGAEAVCMVRAMSETPYDVIIADIRLPDMNGYELMLKLQEAGRSGAAGPDDRLRMTRPFDRQRPQGRAAAWAILYKPFRLDQLLTAVEHILQEPAGAAA